MSEIRTHVTQFHSNDEFEIKVANSEEFTILHRASENTILCPERADADSLLELLHYALLPENRL
ncbi:hypothetical protein [Kiloniella antarctica]|uniref:Uncharacterized protein n=1 Tax=Kiloniella antarctica TaxID=1550907 RepID=A0ABW5BKB2_9PROT